MFNFISAVVLFLFALSLLIRVKFLIFERILIIKEETPNVEFSYFWPFLLGEDSKGVKT